MSSYYPALVALKDALHSGVCHWEKITEKKRKMVVAEYIKSGASLANGKRAERSDKGKKRRKGLETETLDAESSDSEDEGVRATVAEIIANGALDHDREDDSREVNEPASKRRRESNSYFGSLTDDGVRRDNGCGRVCQSGIESWYVDNGG